MGGSWRRRKRLGYRDQSGADLLAHSLHWQGFEFNGGPVIVAAAGAWGKTQGWFESEAEGKRVIRHAMAIAGVAESDVDWVVTVDRSGRSDTVRRFRVVEGADGVGVSTRVGPGGMPETAR